MTDTKTTTLSAEELKTMLETLHDVRQDIRTNLRHIHWELAKLDDVERKLHAGWFNAARRTKKETN